ncbi:AMMECR1 domain protein [Hallella multisaccharivorax DSM 17128]|uniref:AMMECR1 domain protein n=2 Tax=Hallella multisaccharivorax TaxID=310514 RepID=F8N845_9BACT|nr:AMMECR1 domain protein [Hallella multisaccharivorax DSM 17128]
MQQSTKNDLSLEMMRRISIVFVALLTGVLAMAQNVRQMAVAGQFYAASRQDLQSDLEKCYAEGRGLLARSGVVVGDSARVQAVIVPHAGYVFSGSVAASAFASIPKDASYQHIFLLGPSHHVAFDGVSVCSVFDAYRTPLGDVAVDTKLCKELMRRSPVFTYVSSAHDREHCLEVQLPFLQYRLASLPPIVPMIIGTQDFATLKKMAEVLMPYFTPDNLFVVSSDFSHYPSYSDALTVDRNSGEAITTGRLDKFVEALRENECRGVDNLYTSACGQSAIAVLLMMAAASVENPPSIHHIAYLNSGDSPYGGKKEVVGYHAFCVLRNKMERKASHADSLLTENDKQQLRNVAWNAILPENRHVKVVPTEIFERKLGVFVTLTEHGKLRGCIGHFGEDVPLGMLTQEMAHAAAFEDPRFQPVSVEELDDIQIEISVLTPLRRIRSIDEFHYGKQGIYMRKGWRSGTFLPQVADEVNWTKEEFLGHCAQDKAGIGWDGWKTAELYTYEAIVF